jgi:hypothetical protein
MPTTICRANWTEKVRPHTSYTNPLKVQLMRAYGLSGAPQLYELDHLIPLSLGGDPTSPANLWPQAHGPPPGSKEKDTLEVKLKNQVCKGLIKLEEAQRKMMTDWVALWNEMGQP